MVLAGCAGSVAVLPPDPAPSGPAAQACQALAEGLPDRVDGQDRRTTDPDSSWTAAWGDPPIVLRCGVATPAALAPTSELLEVNGVAWLPERLSAGVAFTAIGRAAAVEVLVPEAYQPAANALTDLAAAVQATIPEAASD